jgi:peptidoglycan/LPS O-acetylase OafA/YrhL
MKKKISVGSILEVMTVLLVLAFAWICEGIVSIVAPIVFVWAVWVFAHESGHISKFSRARPLVRLGDWSYSIYMARWLIIIEIAIPCDEQSCT